LTLIISIIRNIIIPTKANSNLLFTYANVGIPERCNEASIFQRSALSLIIEHPIYGNHFRMVNIIKIQCQLIADSAFIWNITPLKPFAERPKILKPHSTFNYRLSRARSSVEKAFGSLKNRLRLLHRKMEYNLNNTTNMVKASTILHKKLSCNVHTNGDTDVREALADVFYA
jgi:hypothetical protein